MQLEISPSGTCWIVMRKLVQEQDKQKYHFMYEKSIRRKNLFALLEIGPVTKEI